MKKTLFKALSLALVIATFVMPISAQYESNAPLMTQATTVGEDAPRYRLFPTQNNWTFLKLDTRTGRIWHVQYTINEGSSFQNIISLWSQVEDSEDALNNGRFTLQPTKNRWTFLLLDQVDGRIWHVQWSIDDSPEGIMEEIE